MPRLEFSQVHPYQSKSDGISLPIALRCGTAVADAVAHVDTGASDCLFDRALGELLNLEVEAGEPRAFATAAGRLDTFGHAVVLETFGMSFESMVYFFADPRIKKNLLGRRGWLDRVRFGLVDHDQLLYLAPYDFEA